MRVFFLVILRPPGSTLFPDSTLLVSVVFVCVTVSAASLMVSSLMLSVADDLWLVLLL